MKHSGTDGAYSNRTAAGYQPLHDTLAVFLQQQAALCDRLEEIADRLPDSIDSHSCLQVAQAVVPVILRAHEFEEKQLFPELLLTVSSSDLHQTIERLRFEHLGDEDYANDVCLALRQFAIDRSRCNVDSLAWMLRGFFEGLRRHIAFEREHISPMLARIGTCPGAFP